MDESFQHFTEATDAGRTPERLKRLRRLMAEEGADAYLVPRADEHQGEYVQASAERLRWLTGFSGSAGMAAVTRRKAVLAIDGRYTLQVRAQVDLELFELIHIPDQKISDWLSQSLPAGATIMFDPWLHTLVQIERLAEAVKPRKLEVKPLKVRRPREGLVDRAWGSERPGEPVRPAIVQPLEHAGTPASDKIEAVRKQLAKDGQDAVVLTLPDSICWLLNIRGQDVPHNPVLLSFAIVPSRGEVELYVEPAKITADVATHIGPYARVLETSKLLPRLKAFARDGRKVRLDTDTAAPAIAHVLKKSMVRGRDPCIDLKARKCVAEIKGARAAHLRDGAAVCRFLAWLDANAPSGRISEIDAVRHLEEIRRATGLLRDISFDTISGSGPNGAIVHYRVTEATNRRLGQGELFLIDSGAQYADGTTDITRTVAVGRPTDAMRKRYTAVLKGHVAISTARFPKGTRGVDLDPLARAPLWALGLDYDHGTGHGVGSYLSVHEGPAGISKRSVVELEPGMILSNEPGFYATGAYGIRIENLVLVQEPGTPAGGERAMMSFETLTLAPYDRRLIAVEDLTQAELASIDAYHARVRAEIGPQLDGPARAWLEAAAAPLRP